MPWHGSFGCAQVHRLGLANHGIAHQQTSHDGARVLRVFDGDCFSFRQGKRIVYVRLWGIDAPECAQVYGPSAKTALNVLLRNHRLTITPIAKDRYKRTVARIATPETPDVGLELIRMGYAWYWDKYAPNVDRYRNAQFEARSHQRGLWHDPHPVPPWDWRKTHQVIIPVPEDVVEIPAPTPDLPA